MHIETSTIEGTVTHVDDNVIAVEDDVTSSEVDIWHNGNIPNALNEGWKVACTYEIEYVEAFDAAYVQPQHTLISCVVL